jgi:hypothetical protein
MSAELGEPRVAALHVQEEGLTADIEYDVSHADMNGRLKKTIEVWDELNEGQKNQFNLILEAIVGLLG